MDVKQDYEDTQKTAEMQNTLENKGYVANQAVHQTIHGNVYYQSVPDGTSYEYLQRESVDGAAYNFRPPKKDFKSHVRDKEPPECLGGTRVNLLKEIEEWSTDPENKYIFWLNGMAGTGKSTIARTVARKLDTKGCLGANFFFSRDSVDLNNAERFFITLASRLTRVSPNLKNYIYDAIAEPPKINTVKLQDQWERLILRPLKKLKDNSLSPSPLIFVIDALDECNEDDAREILRIFTKAEDLKTIQLRVFITSRPETLIRSGFDEMPEIVRRDLELHNISSSIVGQDIALFLKYELRKIRKNWPSKQDIDILAKRADCLFIYAATVCRFIAQSRHPERRLFQLLNDDTVGTSPIRPLDKIYTKILERSILRDTDKDDSDSDKDGEDQIRLFKDIVGSIVVLFDPLSVFTLTKLLAVAPADMGDTLDPLHSVLNSSRDDASPIRLLHLSFRDFLLDKERCQDKFWIEEKMAHKNLFIRCLKLMSEHLKRDIYNLRSPGAPATLATEVHGDHITKCLPNELQYACRYWVEHLRRSEARLGDNVQVHHFLQKHFLHWLEALALIGKISDGAVMLSTLESILKSIVHDAKPFILRFGSMMEKAPLQTYYAALIFSPRQSNIVRQFWDQRYPRIKNAIHVGKAKNLSPLQTLKGHWDWIHSVAFSPDGKLVASGSRDETVRLWDAATGAPHGEPLEGHSDWVRSVAFSPDGKLVVSGSRDKTVRLWDAATGAPHGEPLEGHSDWVHSVTFSPDGKLVASGSYDKTVRLWDAATGAPHGEPLKGHSAWIYSVAFSPDGKLVVSGSRDETVRLWDAATGAPHGEPLEGHSGSVHSVAFSPDGKLVASGSDDKTVRLWDAATGAPHRKPLEGHSAWVCSVAFSPDGKLVASGSGDKTVRLWDTATGTPHGKPFEGHSASVHSVTFSPDGKLVVSGSYDKTVRLWDAAMETPHGEPLEGHSAWIYSVAFSPDGKLVASGSGDKTVRLWDAATGVPHGKPLEGHSASVHSVAFSPDGKLVASGSYDKTVRLWDAATGAPHGELLKGHSAWVRSVAFSPDGKLVASGSNDKMVRLWDAATGTPHGKPLKGHSAWIYSVTFSPDGKLVASGSGDKTVRLWDAATGAPHGKPLEGHSDWVRSVAFSPDGKLVASGSRDETVRLWDAATGAPHGEPLEGHSDWVHSVAFSPDGKLVAPSIVNDWVTKNTEKVIWLPPDYHAICGAVWGDLLVLGHSSGAISFFEFN